MLQPAVLFDDSGGIDVAAYEARFTALPNKQLLTLAIVPPDAWMVQSVYAIYDLDNIKLENVGSIIFSDLKSYVIILHHDTCVSYVNLHHP